MFDALIQDLRHALRALLRSPAFTLAAVLTLAAGIGANSALFSVINAVLLRPLPYERPDELVQVFETFQHRQGERASASPGEFLAWRERNEAFAAVGATVNFPGNLTGSGDPEQISTARVSTGFFSMLGIEPALGRDFGAEEYEPGKDDVALLTDGLWQRSFGGDRGVVGRTINLDGRPLTVVGILPPGARLLQNFDLAIPYAFKDADRTDRSRHFIDVVARLRPGVDLKQAQAAADTLAEALNADRPAGANPHRVALSHLQEEVVGSARPALRMLLGAVGFVLLIACANVAGLLLSRAATRERDLAIRAALGASRARLAGHLLSEALVLSVLGGGLGLLVSVWGVDLLPRLVPGGLPRVSEIRLDGQVVAFTLCVTLLSGVLVGLVPALHFGRVMPQAALQAGGRGLTEGRRRQRLRSGLVGTEIALTLVLLVGASLLMRSFLRLRALDPGFRSDSRLVANLSLPQAKYPDGTRITTFYDALDERLQAMPGVEAAGLVSELPLGGSNSSSNYTIEGEDETASDQRPNANRRSVSAGYFRAMGMHLLKGRALTERDTASAPAVAIINETLARRFPGGDALGRRLRLGAGRTSPNPWMEVVGIVADVRHQALDQVAREEMYLPYTQRPRGEMMIVLNARGDAESLSSALRSEVRSVDPDQAIASIQPMETIVDFSLAPRRASLTLLGAFAGIAVLLAAIGLYGLIAYSVTQRTQEIGVRMALGARARDVLVMVLRQGLSLAAAGVAAGLLAALLLSRLMTGLLYGVGAADPWTFVVVPLVLALVAVLASVLPARRAARVDPMAALRSE